MLQHNEAIRERGIFYGWWLVGLFVLVNAMVSGPVFGGVGVWVKSLEQHFGWSRTQLTGAFAIAQLEGSILGPPIGYITDRVGARRMVLTGLLIMGVGFVLFSQTTNLAIFYLSYTIIMMGGAAGVWLPLMTTLNRWFVRKRSTAMAIGGEGFFLGGILMVPIMAWAVSPDNFGWRTTALGIGIVFLAVAWPIAKCIRNRPEQYGQRADGDPLPVSLTAEQADRRDIRAARSPDFTVRQALRTPAFWYIAFGQGFSAMLIATLAVHLIPLLTDQGISLQVASYVWAVMMAAGAASQLVGGYLADRLPKSKVIFVFCTIQAGGFAMAAFVHDAPMAFLFAVLYGIGFGGRMPGSTAIRGDYFGQRAFATITGISQAPMYIVMLAAPLFAGAMFDIRGSYFLPITILGSLGFLSGVCFLLAKKPVLISPARRTGETGVSA